MTKKNILMLTPYLPYPPISGGRMRTYSLVKRLQATYNITLVCFGRPEEQAFDLAPMRELCQAFIVIDRAPSPSALQAALLSMTSIKPITMRLYRSAEFANTVRRLLNEQQFDVVHVESFYMLQNLPSDCTIPILLSEPAIEYIAWWRHAKVAQPLYQRPAIALEALKMRIFEARVWQKASVVGVMSKVDAEIVGRFAPTAPAPNGVDVQFFQPAETPRRPATAIFMGDYKYFPNSDAVTYFVKDIMPHIRAKRPDFELFLLGKDPTPELIALSEAPNSGITITGLVPDTRPYLAQATLFICPLRSGSGTRFKLMEALASGLPVVTTTVGCEGLDPEPDTHMVVADTIEGFAAAVLRIIENPTIAHQLAEQGRAWVVENHAWEHSARLVANAYEQLIAKQQP